MGKIKDLTGQRFKELLVLSLSERKTKSGGTIWICLCDCGRQKEIASTALISGQQCCGDCRVKKVNIGDRFGRLTVVSVDHTDRATHRTWFLCKCDCGNLKTIVSYSLTQGNTQSCGCLQKEKASKAKLTHGKTSTKEYRAYRHMKYRCLDTKDKDYHNYGGRGITICERWLESFENFYEDMGDAPSPVHQIDRIDVNGNYEPENCRWATLKQQQNNKRTNKHIIYQGETKTVSEWADYFGISSRIIHQRISYGLHGDDLFGNYDRRYKL